MQSGRADLLTTCDPKLFGLASHQQFNGGPLVSTPPQVDQIDSHLDVTFTRSKRNLSSLAIE
ncbi:hypothetical protein PCANC_20497 [Puccinia coronata f. sp. avenae]|uniref:Uncharacterized protein n=1 Tax=Puccinia coronata f. sp. avenae TaxID=200324 RepID=A0A2N5SQ63_9BASI|nr:hypothetical protein PCANC_20497 [Puccinia coronata f. sp. avenae]